MTAVDFELTRAIEEAGKRVEALRCELLDSHPELRKNLAVAGIFVGHGLAALVANGLTDDQIVTHVLDIVGQIRKVHAAQDCAASVH